MVRKALLICGILSSAVYVSATVLGAMQWKGYSWTSQSVSELFALDAPSRSVVASSFLLYGILVIAFGCGVWMSAGANRALRVVGGALTLYGIAGLPGPIFFSMHTYVRGGNQMMQNDALHIVLTAVLVLLIVIAVGFGAAAFGRRFRIYSIATLASVVIFGALAGSQATAIAAAQPTPWLGLAERINIFSFMLWVVVLAGILLRVPEEQDQSKA
jgi:hypothetical protein